MCEHATKAVTVTVEDGRVVTIVDDGPGIPEKELTTIDAENETRLQHDRGLGLWQRRWCVDTPNGRPPFETGAGTTVRISYDRLSSYIRSSI